jgi:hypothetical protein
MAKEPTGPGTTAALVETVGGEAWLTEALPTAVGHGVVGVEIAEIVFAVTAGLLRPTLLDLAPEEALTETGSHELGLLEPAEVIPEPALELGLPASTCSQNS